ncbi:MAG: sialate O-acetylesterase, partial [Kiritimatiellales bacterium]
GVQANSTAVYAIPAGATQFVAVVGADAEAAGVNLSRHGLFSMVFEVYGDTKEAGSKPVLLVKSPVISHKTIKSWAFNIGLDPIYKELRLVVDDAGDGNNSDFGDWVEAGFVVNNAKRTVKVFILAGQSNAVGFNNVREYRNGKAALPEEYMSQADTLFWDEKTKGWIPLCVGKSHGAHTNAFGPEIGFAHDLAKLADNGQIAIIKYAVGGTGIARARDYSDIIPNVGPNDAGNNWHPPSNGQDAGKLYQQLMRETEHALSALKSDGRTYELSAFLWMQGEREAVISPKMAGDYETLLKSLIRSIRTDLKTPALPFVIGEVNSHTWKYGDIVRKAQDTVCKEDGNAVLVKTTDLSRKGSGGVTHFDADGMIELGSRFATAVNQLTRKN